MPEPLSSMVINVRHCTELHVLMYRICYPVLPEGQKLAKTRDLYRRIPP